MNPSRVQFTRFLLIPSLALAFSPALQAAESSWTAGPGDWAVPGNWDLGVPNAATVGSEEGNISNGGSATISSAVPNVQNVYVGKNGGNSGTLTIATGGSLTITGTGESLKIGTDGGSGTLNQTGGTLSQTAGDFRLGNYGAGATGTYNLSGGTAVVNQVRVGIGNATQTGILNQTGGSLTNTGEFKVGSSDATGSYNLSGVSSVANLNDVKVGQYTNSTGTFTQSAGTLTTTGEFQVGTDGGTGTLVINNAAATANIRSFRAGQGGGTGIVNHSAGTLNNTTEMFVGLNGGNGTYNLSGTGVVNSVDERVRLAVGNGSVGVVNQSGGTFNVAAGRRLELSEDGGTATYNLSGGALNVSDDILVGGFGAGGTGTFTQTGGIATVGRVRVAYDPGKTGVLNLNGGVMAANQIFKEGAPNGGNASINFNGGTVQARQNEGNFITNFTNVNIQAGGATVDSNGFDIGIGSPLVGVGSLTKIGTNQLKLNSVNTYQGNTIINGGQLTILPGAAITFDINTSGVNSQVTGNGSGSFLVLGSFAFDLTDASAGGSWTIINSAGLAAPVTYDGAFSVLGFTNAGSGLWTSGTYTFDQNTGLLTSPVPEPSTWALAALGLFVFIAARRRRQPQAL